jgi:putative ABC transport system permease protein
VAGAEVEVIGVMKRPAASFPGQDDSRIMLPYFTMHKLFPSAQENMLIVLAKDGQLPEAIDQLTAMLRQERHVPLSAPDNFFVSTADQFVEDFRSVTAMVTLVMIVLSSIGLLVGGIGVMNIMLISVTERTGEIGIRKAIGARRSDIRLQFLTEAMSLSVIGGLIGIALGALISLGVRTLLPDVPATVSLLWVALGVGMSAAVGIFFGYYPANRAANLDPIVCLRYE